MNVPQLTAAIDAAFSFTAHGLHRGGLDVHCRWDFYPVTGNEEHLIRHRSTLADRDIPVGRPLTPADLAERMRKEVFRTVDDLARVMDWLTGYVP